MGGFGTAMGRKEANIRFEGTQTEVTGSTKYTRGAGTRGDVAVGKV